MLDSFKGLKIFQLSEYLLLALFAFVVPFSWRIATFITIAIFAATLLKGIFEEGFKPNPLQYQNKFTYIVFIAFWFLYAISFFYSEDTAEARIQIGRKLPFFLFPIFFLCSNLSYLNKDRVRTIMYCFVFGILTLFIVNLLWAGYDVIFEGSQIKRFSEPDFLKEGTGYIHHTYISLYSCLGIGFCFYELFSQDNIRIKLLNIISLVMLALFIVISSSRAGIICASFIFFIMWLWLAFVKKGEKIAFIVGIVIFCLIFICGLVFKSSINRITETISNLNNIEKQDRRIGITIGYKDLLTDKFWFGVGCGDRSDETLKSYLEKKEELIQNIQPINNIYYDEFDTNRRECIESINKKSGGILNDKTYKYAQEMSNKYQCDYISVRKNLATYININVAINSECNAHNQFSDTIIAVGIIGLLLFLMMLIIPIYLGIKNKKSDIVLISLVSTIAFNSLFESVLERQMGIMFFVFFYFILFHGTFCQQRIENRS